MSLGDGDEDFGECYHDTRQRLPLCRMSTVLALGKKHTMGPFVSYFAEGIRWQSAKPPSLSSAHRTSTQQREHQRALG